MCPPTSIPTRRIRGRLENPFDCVASQVENRYPTCRPSLYTAAEGGTPPTSPTFSEPGNNISSTAGVRYWVMVSPPVSGSSPIAGARLPARLPASRTTEPNTTALIQLPTMSAVPSTENTVFCNGCFGFASSRLRPAALSQRRPRLRCQNRRRREATIWLGCRQDSLFDFEFGPLDF